MVGRTDAEMHSPETEQVIHDGDMRVLRDEEASYREMTVRDHGSRPHLPHRPVPVYRPRRQSGRHRRRLGRDHRPARSRTGSIKSQVEAQEHTIEELRVSRQEAWSVLAGAIAPLRRRKQAARRAGWRAPRAYLASRLGLSERQIQLLKTAAPMHDVGNVAVPPEILHKPGPADARGAGADGAPHRGRPPDPLRLRERADADGGARSPSATTSGSTAAVTPGHWRATRSRSKRASSPSPTSLDALLSERPYRPAMSVEEARALIEAGARHPFRPADRRRPPRPPRGRTRAKGLTQRLEQLRRQLGQQPHRQPDHVGDAPLDRSTRVDPSVWIA